MRTHRQTRLTGAPGWDRFGLNHQLEVSRGTRNHLLPVLKLPPRARSLQAALKDSLGIEAKLTGGSGGVFRVLADGQTLFDRHSAGGRYPEPQEILDALGK